MQFRIVALDTIEAHLVAPTQNLPKEIIFQFDVSLDHRWNLDDQILIVGCNVSIFINEKQTLLAQLKANTVFQIDQLATYIDDKKLNLPTDFTFKLNDAAISTTRGILYAFLKGTHLHNAILPFIEQNAVQKTA